MTEPAAHQSAWETSEVVFGIPLILGIGLHFVVPWSIPPGIVRLAMIPAGITLFILGAGFVVLARREFARQGQRMDPGHPTGRIVKAGVFSISRNPLYLGVAIALAGFALALDIPWVLFSLAPALIACHYVLIAPEERYLAEKFGDEYRDYRRSVRRWLGRRHPTR